MNLGHIKELLHNGNEIGMHSYDHDRLNFMDYPELTFEQPDIKTFRNLQLAYDCMDKGGNTACILNAANEIAVDKFLRDEIGFLEISDLIERSLSKVSFVQKPTLEDYINTDKETRALALEYKN